MSVAVGILELQQMERDTWDEDTLTRRVLEVAIGNGWQAVHFMPAYTGTINRDTGKPRVRTPYIGEGKGFPDIVAIHKTIGFGIAWELKKRGHKCEPEQERWLKLFGAAGFHNAVYDTTDWLTMMEYLEGKRP
jgi:hypothetical protein